MEGEERRSERATGEVVWWMKWKVRVDGRVGGRKERRESREVR